MYCTNCGQHKDEEQFRSPLTRQLLAYCADCRSALIHGGKSLASQIDAPRSRKRATASEREKFLDAQRDRTNGPNIVLIQDAQIARDLAWFFELNSSIGARNADNR